MAQTNSIYNQPLSGNLGSQTYKNYGGKQVITARFYTTSAKGEGASRAQRDTRMLMPNLTLIGSQLKDWLPALWEDNKLFHRPYTHFIGQNMHIQLPVMPKEQIDLQNCVWGGLQVSYGTLPSIKYFHNQYDQQMSDIRAHIDYDMPNTTLKELSKSIINLNPSFRNGDFIVFVRASYTAYESASPVQGYYCTPLVSALTLDVDSSEKVYDTIKGDPITMGVGSNSLGGSCLYVSNEAANSIAFVHVRKYRGRYLASSQLMSTDFHLSSRLEGLSDPAYINYCAASWGYKDRIL